MYDKQISAVESSFPTTQSITDAAIKRQVNRHFHRLHHLSSLSEIIRTLQRHSSFLFGCLLFSYGKSIG